MPLCATSLLTRGYITACISQVLIKDGLTSCHTPMYQTVVEVRPKIRRAAATLEAAEPGVLIMSLPVTTASVAKAGPADAETTPTPVGAESLIPKIIKAEEE